ncbi:hypothetical protein MFRU_013g01200 [Monilinia fructicola]|uniref:TauD/TfdA-like domain-containing protein n=1 Tax=Monilinia fructicola TaxID=38448 RepID=A0A5M9J9I3_MONFR|nr:hypothetical protein EYC84_011460 [Monilinia fructicola]KAG4030096.1 hypothetical protein MFRU_013g01200 [Monilinia fructicola]
MSALRFGINCSRRGATSCALLTAPRVSRNHRRLFSVQSSDINQPSRSNTSLRLNQTDSKDANLPIKAEIVNCDDQREWLKQIHVEPQRVQDFESEIFQKNSPQIIKVNGVAYPPLFLRDSCSCHRCVDPSSKQKNFQTSDIPPKIKATSIIPGENGELKISWENDIPAYGSSHVSSFSKKFFDTHSSTKAYHSDRHNKFVPVIWNAKTIAQKLQYVTYDDYVNTEEGLFRALIMLRDYGLLILRDVPDSETSVINIAKRIGNLRDTLYGVTWNVKSIPQAKNVAYTSKYLGLHMDLLYMTNPPGFQFLHCLRNTCSGGSSIFSDSFHAATQLDEHNFATLCKKEVGYHYRNAGEHYHYKHPVIATQEVEKGKRRLHMDTPLRFVNYSPPFQAPFDKSSDSIQLAEALRQFASRVEAPENMFEYRLQEGECVIFNNRRVLHGRKEFDTSAGERWFKGAYIDTDVFMSRYRVLAEKYQNHDRKFLRTHARYISWDIQNPETGRMESDPHKVWERSRNLPQTEGYANII